MCNFSLKVRCSGIPLAAHLFYRFVMRIAISEGYLKEEIRDGFTIPEKMKRSWAVQLKLLSLIDDICQRHGLRWFADYGTLLGAVRHSGYIPWDDDIDIAMLREDYDKAMEILPEELPKECQVMRFGTESNLWRGWSNVNNRRNIDTGDDACESVITDVWYGSPYVDGLDIYPLDYIPANVHMRNDILTVYENLMIALRGYPRDQVTVQQKDLCVMAEQLARTCDREHAIGVGNITVISHYGQPWREIEWYDNPVMVPFEMIQIPIPSGYRRILEDVYGPEWYIPQQAKCAHGYPFYAPQDKFIEDYKVGKAVNEIEAIFDGGAADLACKRVLSYLRQFPRRYEIYYVGARIMAGTDPNLAADYLKHACDLCEDGNKEALQSYLDQILK